MAIVTAPTVRTVAFTVNGAPVEVQAAGGRRLLDVLREDLGLRGTKEGCGEGECGACSVVVDGEVVVSCLVPVAQVAGAEVRTVEGLGGGGELDPLQQAFVERGGTQCGICAPGILMAARAYLDGGGTADDASIRAAISGNLCRCTGYTKVVEAIAAAAAASSSAPKAPPRAGERVAVRRIAAAPWRDPVVLRPATLAEALRLLDEPEVRPIAGGTDLMVALASGTVDPGVRLLDLSGLDELRGIRIEGDELVLGALTTYAELRRSPVVEEVMPILARAAAEVGAAQIQGRGTIGGNVMTASPAGDMLPILLASDAALWLVGPGGERIVPAAAFWVGYRRTAAAPDELLAALHVPLQADRRIRFRKVGTRRAQAISKVVIAVSWVPDRDGGAWRDVRVALGSVAEVPLRAVATERLLEGARPGRDVAERARGAVEAEIRPIDDVRSSAAYRRAVAGRVLRRIVLDEAGTAAAGG